MANKLVSVIIPFFNRIDLLKASMKSVTEQTYSPIELILVDDHSTEKPDEDLIKKYSSKNVKIKIIRNEVNLGPGLSREEGRLIAKGEYFAYLDSDDFWHDQFLEKLIYLLEKNSDVGMAYSKTLLIRNTGNFLRNKNDQTFDKIIPILFDVHGRPWATGACVWKRQIVNKIGNWSSSRIWEDYEYDVRAAIINNKIIHVPEVLFYVNMDSKEKISLVKNTEQMIMDKANSILNISRFLRKSKFFSDADIKKRITYYLLTSCATLSDFKSDKGLIKNLFKEYYYWKGKSFTPVSIFTPIFPSKVNSKIFRKIRQYFTLLIGLPYFYF
ncbi:MAG: glycosyltransferase family 2 protein [Ignavibacteria bacterium]|nr:glycosyltransferase family 2 protein [Ignavibacteria bacterium]